jgi:hypothetical protein
MSWRKLILSLVVCVPFLGVVGCDDGPTPDKNQAPTAGAPAPAPVTPTPVPQGQIPMEDAKGNPVNPDAIVGQDDAQRVARRQIQRPDNVPAEARRLNPDQIEAIQLAVRKEVARVTGQFPSSRDDGRYFSRTRGVCKNGVCGSSREPIIDDIDEAYGDDGRYSFGDDVKMVRVLRPNGRGGYKWVVYPVDEYADMVNAQYSRFAPNQYGRYNELVAGNIDGVNRNDGVSWWNFYHNYCYDCVNTYPLYAGSWSTTSVWYDTPSWYYYNTWPTYSYYYQPTYYSYYWNYYPSSIYYYNNNWCNGGRYYYGNAYAYGSCSNSRVYAPFYRYGGWGNCGRGRHC